MANSKPVNNQKASRGKNRRAGNVKPSAEQQRSKLAKDLGLTIRQRSFVDELINSKGISATEAYIRAYGINGEDKAQRQIAGVNASRLLKNDKVNIYKDSAISKAKGRIVSLVSSSNESIALKASQDILDRTTGKAVQKNENISKSVEVKLDLTGLRVGSHAIEAPKVPVE